MYIEDRFQERNKGIGDMYVCVCVCTQTFPKVTPLVSIIKESF